VSQREKSWFYDRVIVIPTLKIVDKKDHIMGYRVGRGWLISVSVFFSSLCFAPFASSQIGNSDDFQLLQSQLIYTPQEMLNFNIEEYLENTSPELAEFAEIISHWSGYSSISPKILLAMIENQTVLITAFDEAKMARPLGGYSNQIGFSNQVEDVAGRLAASFYEQRNVKGISFETLLGSALHHVESQERMNLESISTTYYSLFPGEAETSRESAEMQIEDEAALAPPENLLQLPYPVGESWRFGGSHVSSGSGTYPQSSLDFFTGSGGWGSDTSPYWVSSSTAGTAVRHSSCFVEVIHSPNGWSTSYYHLDNVQITTGQNVAINTPLANYANTQAQALCDGGSSTGPHLHYSLKNNGSYYHLDGVKLSGYTVHTGRYSYDTDCDYFWIDDDGTKRCAWSNLYNPGVESTPAAPTFISASDGNFTDRVSVMWASVSGATSYRVYRCTTTTTDTCTEINSGPGTSFNDSSAALEVTYYYRVQACNSYCSDYSGYDSGFRTVDVQTMFPVSIPLLLLK